MRRLDYSLINRKSGVMGFIMSISLQKTPYFVPQTRGLYGRSVVFLRLPEVCDRRTHRTHFRSDTMKVYQYTMEV